MAAPSPSPSVGCWNVDCADPNSSSLKKCSGCHVAEYCSVACQTTHWRTHHKHFCIIDKEGAKWTVMCTTRGCNRDGLHWSYPFCRACAPGIIPSTFPEKCVLEGCYKRIDVRELGVCLDHEKRFRCQNRDCFNKRIEKSRFCEKHTCGICWGEFETCGHKCVVRNCFELPDFENVCRKHLCESCFENGEYVSFQQCSKHKCCIKQCSRRKENGLDTCNMHSCKVCQAPSVGRHRVCELHRCSYTNTSKAKCVNVGQDSADGYHCFHHQPGKLKGKRACLCIHCSIGSLVKSASKT